MFLGHVWVDGSQGILPVALTQLKDLFTLSYFQVGVLMMILNLTSSVIQPFFGIISDRFSTGWFVPVGILWTSVTMGLLGWAPNYTSAIVLVGLAGLGTAAFHPRASMAVFFSSRTRRGLGAAIFATGGNLGFAIGPLVGGFLIFGFGLHATLGLVPFALLLFLAILFYPSNFLKQESPRRDQQRDTPETTLFMPWVSIIAVCLIVTLRSWVYISLLTYLPMFLETKGIALSMGSLMLTVFLAGGAAAGLYGGHLSDRFGRRRVIVVTLFLYPILASLFIVMKGAWLWLLAATSGAALLASFSVTIVLAQELMPRHLGLASGLILGLGFGTGGLGSALSGYLADAFGLYVTMWILAVAPIMAVALPAFIRPVSEGLSEAGSIPLVQGSKA
jgi:FSR family fosmidomycin resistance protein-like MFS transporter